MSRDMNPTEPEPEIDELTVRQHADTGRVSLIGDGPNEWVGADVSAVVDLQAVR